jgi:hypothetical protein
MSPAAIGIVPSKLPLPTSSPNLMPFHIDYTGKAPIDAYFQVKEQSSRYVAQPTVADTDQNDSEPDLRAEPIFTTTADKTRFVSTFRGRTVDGVEVGLPEGYGGITLRDVGPWESTTMNGEDVARNLHPFARFSSIVLWNGDVPVDEGKDEYVRSLREWMKLSEEVIGIFLCARVSCC